MASNNLVILSGPDSGSREKLLTFLSGRRFSWAYLGQDIVEMARWKDVLGADASFVETTRQFHASGEALRGPYLTELYRTGRDFDSLRWWITSVSYRNGILSKSFHHACLLKTGLNLATDWSSAEPLVLVASDTVREALKQNLRKDANIHLQVAETSRPGRLQFFTDAARMLLHRFFFAGRECYRVRCARRALPELPKIDHPTALVLSWATPHNIDLKSEFHSSFFGPLAEGIEGLNGKVAIAPIIVRELRYKDALSSLQGGDRPLLVPHRFLSYRNVLWAAISGSMRPPKPPFAQSFCGMDIRWIINEELRTYWISNAAADTLLIPPVIRRWASLGYQISQFIYVYENQPMERALCWEATHSFPQSAIVGFQHAGTPRFWLNVHLSPDGEPEAPLPDRIVTIGSYTAGVLLKNGHQPDKLKVGGGLLTQGLVEQLSSIGPTGPKDGVPTILVAPSDGLEESAELTALAAGLFDEDQSYRVIIKYHPRMPFEKLQGITGMTLPEGVEVTEAPITELMSESSMMIYSGSTVSFQALAIGLPTIHIVTQFDLDLDPLDEAQATRLAATGLEELQEKVRWLLENRADYIEQNKQSWDSLVRSAYGPVNEDTYRAFIDLAAN